MMIKSRIRIMTTTAIKLLPLICQVPPKLPCDLSWTGQF